MTKLFGGTIRAALVHALTEYDRKEEQRAARSRRGYHNPYALAQYLARIDEICADIEAGAAPRDAIVAAFTGRVLDCALRAIGAEEASFAESQGLGKVFYRTANKQGNPS